MKSPFTISTSAVFLYINIIGVLGFIASTPPLQQKRTTRSISAVVPNDDGYDKNTCQHTATLDLGSIKDVKVLFSYPNNPEEQQSLKETVQHYLQSSLRRDGFSSANLQILDRDDHMFASITGEGAREYAQRLPVFLKAGLMGHRSCLQLQKNGLWQEGDWRFFLPLGIALIRHTTVQLLHFPPLYTLEREQDYLASRTTKRWAQLLQENGVADTDRFQTILDICPIAAPSNNGRQFLEKGVSGYFGDYQHSMLRLFVAREPANPVISTGKHPNCKPIVAFGFAVHQWIATEFFVGQRDRGMNILNLSMLQLDDNLVAPTLMANHPSFVYNAGRNLKNNPLRLGVLIRIMQQDLIAARWQATMGLEPQSDPSDALRASKRHWGNPLRFKRICELSRIHGLGEDPDQAIKQCNPAELDCLLSYGPLEEETLIKGGAVQADDIVGQRLVQLKRELAAGLGGSEP